MIALECMLGRMGDHPIPRFLRKPEQLVDAFTKGSNGDIQLTTDSASLRRPIQPRSTEFSALDLHRATLKLTRNPRPPTRSERIAVLFASLYAPSHSVFGMMFDRGFATWDDPNDLPALTGSPREGCAIFVEAIAKVRQGLNFEREALFTTIHEMGHLFNLEHVQLASYMATSKPDAPYPTSAFRFIPQHQDILKRCSTSAFVWPGGEPFAGDKDWSDGGQFPTRASAEFGLELVIDMARREFWRFEPVELEVELRVAAGVNRSFEIPDKVDPGYEEFVIWLESPRGERRRYRSPRHYCAIPATRVIAPQTPFRRDISIFGESGGYTFRSSGVWRIWAEFGSGEGQPLRSNILEVNVKPAGKKRADEIASARLSDVRSAALLYHRMIRRGTSTTKLVIDQLEDSRQQVPSGGLEYAVGRAFMEAAKDKNDGSVKAAREHLKRARDRLELGHVQRDHTDRLLRDTAEEGGNK